MGELTSNGCIGNGIKGAAMLARIRDTEIYFDVEGVGLAVDGPTMREKPVALLSHGGPGGDHTDAKAVCGPLAERMQLVYSDYRGQGRSARGDRTKYTLNENVEDLEALRTYLGVGPIVSIGTSYGGMVAMAHAARYPSSVSHLVLVATAAHAGFISRSREMVEKWGSAEQIALCDDLWAGRLDTPQKLQHYFEVMGPLYSRKFDAARAKAGLMRGILSPEALNQAYGPGGCMRDFDLRPTLREISAPTLILGGRYDWICPPEFSEEIHCHIAGSDLRIFEQSAHTVRADETQAFLDAVRGFIVYRTAAAGATIR
jgi:proline iminopeptidase